MVSDGSNEQSDREREDFLEEVRRRAEEAELRRIEEEESGPSEAPPVAPPPTASVPPTPSVEKASHVDISERIVLLETRIEAAIDRGNVNNALDLLSQLRALAPDSPELARLEDRAHVGRSQEVREEPAPPEVHPVDANQARKSAELLERAQAAYEQENYAQALTLLEEILSRDTKNQEALQLQAEAVRARDLMEVLRQEEAAHRASEQEQFTKVPVNPPERAAQPGSGVWGTTVGEAKSDFEGFAFDAPVPSPLPRPSALYRMGQAIMRIRIPVKPVLIGTLLVVIGTAGYLVVKYVSREVVPPHASILVSFHLHDPGSVDRDVAEGLAADLVDLFSRIPELRVIAVPSAIRVSEESSSPRRNARRVGARYVLHSSTRVQENSIVWDAVLLDTVGQEPLWSHRSQVSMREGVHALHGIVSDVLQQIGIDSVRSSPAAGESATTATIAAYAWYGAGRAALRLGTEEGRSHARALLRRAIAEDSTLAGAFAALGWAMILDVKQGDPAVQDSLGFAVECAQRSLLIDPSCAEGYRVLGMADSYAKNFERSVEHFRHAATLEPSDAETQRRRSVVLLRRGAADEALTAAQFADEADPLNPASPYVLGMVYHFRGEYAQALSCYTRSIQMGESRTAPGSELMADLMLDLQQPDKAVVTATDRATRLRGNPDALYRLGRVGQGAGQPKAEWTVPLQRAKEGLRDSIQAGTSRPWAYAMLALVHTRLGEFKDALEANKTARELAGENPFVLYATARMYALQRDKQKALEYLSSAVDREYLLPEILDLDLFNLRSESGFSIAVTR